MSDAPQQAGPDLHAIFGIDGTPREAAEQIISVGRGVLGDPASRAPAAPTAEVGIELDTERLSAAEVHHDPLPGADVEFETIAGADPYIEVERAARHEPGSVSMSAGPGIEDPGQDGPPARATPAQQQDSSGGGQTPPPPAPPPPPLPPRPR